MLQCPVTLHLLAPVAPGGTGTVAQALRHEHIALGYAAGSPAAGAAEELGRLLGVTIRVEDDLDGLDVAGFGEGALPSSHCVQALEAIADLHRGEHVLVVGGVPAPGDEVVLRRLEIGDDGWRLLGGPGVDDIAVL